MIESECIFCMEYSKGLNTFAETDLLRARWDSLPVSPGHAEILPKRHVQGLVGLTDEEARQLIPFSREVKDIIQRTDLTGLYDRMMQNSPEEFRPNQMRAKQSLVERPGAPSAFNYGVNDGPDAGQTISHFHYHLIPRWKGDVASPRGGVRKLMGPDLYSER